MNDNVIDQLKHSKKNMISWGFGMGLNEFLGMAFGAYGFFFYESEIGLNVWLVSLGFIIYALWNAINDPLVGYLTNRPFKFTKKWGRKFPWIFFGGIPYVFFYILIFTPPNVNPQSGALILFVWLVFTTCLFDTFASIYFVNIFSLFPYKFRSIDERRTATGIQLPIAMLGSLLGAIIPPIFISFGNLQSYIIQGGAVFLVGMMMLGLAIPGCREEQQIIDLYLDSYDKNVKRESFFKMLKIAFKQKSFVIFVIFYFFYQTMVRSMTASIPYLVRFILKMEAVAISMIMLGFFLGVVISTPIWVKLAKKANNNRKIILTASILLVVFTFPLIFIFNYLGAIIAIFFWGIALGGFLIMTLPVLGDIIDESVVITHKREEGTYYGFLQFFSRLAYVSQAISFAIVHSITGFKEGASTQSDLAILGIYIHFAVIPLIAILIGTILFWRIYDLTPDKIKINQEKLKELHI